MKQITILLIAIAYTTALWAQEFSFNHLALSVKDVARSAEFYATVLKLPEIVNRGKIEGVRWFALADGIELHLISTVKENVMTNKAVHLGITTNNFDVFVKRLAALKIMYSDWPGKPDTINVRADGIKQIFFQDPDGYWIEVNNVIK